MNPEECGNVLKEFFSCSQNHIKINTQRKTSTELYGKFSERNTNVLIGKSINVVYSSVKKALNTYIDLHPELNDLSNSWSIDNQFNFQFYYPGEGFNQWHTENIPDRKRILVWSIYFNTLEDGGTEFSCFKHIEKAEVGKILIFPADWTFTHRSQITTSGFKFIATGWISLN